MRVKVRGVTRSEIAQVVQCQKEAYQGLPASSLCDERLLNLQYEAFAEGFLVALKGEEVIGYATALIVQLDDDSPWYSYDEITGGGTFTTHDPSGDTLYGTDIAVHPAYRGKGVAGRLYKARKQLLRRFNLRRMVAGGRIPGYEAVAGRYSPEEYVELVVSGELQDSSLNAHLKAGYKVRGVHMDYLHDEQSLDFATFLEYENPRYVAKQRRIAAAPLKRPVRKVRVCAAQMTGRGELTDAEWKTRLSYFLDAAEEHHCHFLVLPELPRTADPADQADREMEFCKFLGQEATARHLFILAPHPHREGNDVTLRCHLLSPGGESHFQDRLHLTPQERAAKLIQGQGLRVFDTGYARIGILMGYDVLFPELARLQTLGGAEILFVPFRSSERHDYLRLRHTAQARAVENSVYLVMAGTNYGESVILTPCDFGFPQDGVGAASGSTGDTIVIYDLDLGALSASRELGTVRPLRDQRRDSWKVVASNPVEQIRIS